MGHCQHLAVAAQLLHQPAHGVRHRAANAGVHLIKNQCGRSTQLAGGHGNSQSDARELAPRGHFGYRARRAPRVAGDHENHVLQTALLGFFKGL